MDGVVEAGWRNLAVIASQLRAQGMAVVPVSPRGAEDGGQLADLGTGMSGGFKANSQCGFDDAAGAAPLGWRQNGRHGQDGWCCRVGLFATQNGLCAGPVRQAGGEKTDAFDPGGQRLVHGVTPRMRLQLLPPKPKELLRVRRKLAGRGCSTY